MSTEYQIPGGAYVNETTSYQQQIPGNPYVNETVAPVVPPEPEPETPVKRHHGGNDGGANFYPSGNNERYNNHDIDYLRSKRIQDDCVTPEYLKELEDLLAYLEAKLAAVTAELERGVETLVIPTVVAETVRELQKQEKELTDSRAKLLEELKYCQLTVSQRKRRSRLVQRVIMLMHELDDAEEDLDEIPVQTRNGRLAPPRNYH